MWKCSILFSHISILFYSDTFKHRSGWIQQIFPEITLRVVAVFQRQLKLSRVQTEAVMFVSVRLIWRSLAFPVGINRWREKKQKLDQEDENNLPPMGSESVFQNTRFSSRSPFFFSLCRRPGGQRSPVEGGWWETNCCWRGNRQTTII